MVEIIGFSLRDVIMLILGTIIGAYVGYWFTIRKWFTREKLSKLNSLYGNVNRILEFRERVHSYEDREPEQVWQ